MRISELSAASGTPVSTIKYYLREGFLPRGRSVGKTRAVYGAGHLRRLRLLALLLGERRGVTGQTRAALQSLPLEAGVGGDSARVSAVEIPGGRLPPLGEAAVEAGAWIDGDVDALYRKGVAWIVRADRMALARSDSCGRAWTLTLQRLATAPYLAQLRENVEGED